MEQEMNDKEIRLSILRILISNYGFDLEDPGFLTKIAKLASWVIKGDDMYEIPYPKDVKYKEGGA